jgi:hypothetical protein
MERAELSTNILAIIFKWTFHLASHESIKVLFEDGQPNLRAEVDEVAAIGNVNRITLFD